MKKLRLLGAFSVFSIFVITYQYNSKKNKKKFTPNFQNMSYCGGSVIGGVVGHSKYSFDIWGNSVNLAARMEN